MMPKKDRPWLDGGVCIILGFALGVIVGSGIPSILAKDIADPPKAINLRLQKMCVLMKRRPVEDSTGWMVDCVEIKK